LLASSLAPETREQGACAPIPYVAHFSKAQKGCLMSDSIPTITLNAGEGLSPNPAYLKLHASLTTPESEDWIVIPNKNKILIMAMREQRSRSGRLVTLWKGGWCHRTTMLRFLGNLPEKHELGVLSVYVTTDAEAAGTHTLLSRLSDLGKRKSFNVLSVVLPGADTKQCIRCLDPGSSSSQDFESTSFSLMTFH
jgi:hypothetical protein